MDSINELSFESAYNELEEVITKLESGQLSLEESLNLYERGKQLSAHCQALLENAELRIKRLEDDGTLSENNS